MKHTPGPLEVWEPAHDTVNSLADRPLGIVKDGRQIAIICQQGSETRPNADLFAAAPDLLAACEAAEASLSNSVRDGQGGIAREVNLDIVRAAIRKARGE